MAVGCHWTRRSRLISTLNTSCPVRWSRVPAKATVKALELREEGNGKVRFWPVVDLEGLLPGVAEAVGLGDRVRRMIGDQIGGALVESLT